MELTGKIIQALTQRSGLTKQGAPWVAQDFVLDITPKDANGANYVRAQRLLFTVFGADKLAEMHLVAGEAVTVSIDFDAREKEGRWFNSIRAWKVVRVGGQSNAAVQPQPAAARAAYAQPQPQYQAYQPQPQAYQPQPQAIQSNIPY